MAIKLQRGHVEGLTAPGKDGSVECRIRDQKVLVHPNLADKIHNGDDVLVAGELRNDVLQATAVNNFRQNKISHIDCTNYILILGVSGYIGIICGVFGLEAIDSTDWLTLLQYAASIIGLAVAAMSIRRIVMVNRADNCVHFPDLADEAGGTP